MGELTYLQVLGIGLLAFGADCVLGMFIGAFMAVGRGPEPSDDGHPTDRQPCVLPFRR